MSYYSVIIPLVFVNKLPYALIANTLPTHASAPTNEQRVLAPVATNGSRSLAKIALKVPPTGWNHSLVACINMCGECMRLKATNHKGGRRYF
jgi:hypothetical protein